MATQYKKTLIVEHFPHPNKVKTLLAVASNAFAFQNTAEKGHGDGYNKHWAQKKNVSVEEFIKRDAAYKKESKGISFMINEFVYPVSYENYLELGRCRISKVYRSYADEEATWDPEKWGNERPHVLEFLSDKDNSKLWTCTATYLSRLVPVKSEVKQQ